MHDLVQKITTSHGRRNVLKSGGARANSTGPEGKLSFPVEGLLNPVF